MRLIIQQDDGWLLFENPIEVLTARTPEEVFQCLEKIERSGLWAAGFVSYEAASAFDDALKTHPPGNLPLLKFGLFQTLDLSGSESAFGIPQKKRPEGKWQNPIALYLESFQCLEKKQGWRLSLPSTVVQCLPALSGVEGENETKILREGAIPAQEIAAQFK